MTTIPTLNVLPNVRDLGGLPTTAGAPTRPGVLYRSAAPLPDSLPIGLPTWPCRTVIDLKSPGEYPGPHPLEGPDAAVHEVPLLPDRHVRGPNATNTSLVDIYRTSVEDPAAHVMRVLELAATQPAPVLVHCTAGKDHTCATVAMLLACAGGPRADIVTDSTENHQYIAQILARLPRAGDLGAVSTHHPQLLGAQRWPSTRCWTTDRPTPAALQAG